MGLELIHVIFLIIHTWFVLGPLKLFCLKSQIFTSYLGSQSQQLSRLLGMHPLALDFLLQPLSKVIYLTLSSFLIRSYITTHILSFFFLKNYLTFVSKVQLQGQKTAWTRIYFFLLFVLHAKIYCCGNEPNGYEDFVFGVGETWIGTTGNGRSTSFVGGSKGHSSTDILWNMLVAIGDVALASGYAQIAIDIQVWKLRVNNDKLFCKKFFW